MNDIEQKISTALDRIDRAIDLHKPIAVFGLFSGGHDSFSACMVFSKTSSCARNYLHIDTGIGIPLTREYVETTCRDRRWNLIVKEAARNLNAKSEPDPQVYDDIVLKHGFPGPASHGKMYIRLKDRALALVAREMGANCRGKEKKRIMLISGARSQESQRRMANTEEVQIDGRRIWVAPIHDWSKLDTTLLMDYVQQPRNIIVDLIHKSGECLCGAFAKPGELAELGMWPQTRPAYDRIIALQERVKATHPWGWEGKPPKEKVCKSQPGQLCWSCVK